MSKEVTYDTAADAEVIKGHPAENAGEGCLNLILQLINPWVATLETLWLKLLLIIRIVKY